MATTKIIDGDTWQLNPDGRSWVNISAQQRSSQAAKDLSTYRSSTGGYTSNVQVTPVGNQTVFSAQSAVPYSDNPTTTLPVHTSSTTYNQSGSSTPSYQWTPTGESMQPHISGIYNQIKNSLPAGTKITVQDLKAGEKTYGDFIFGYKPEYGLYYKTGPYANSPMNVGLSEMEIGSGERAGMFRYGGDWYNQSGQKVQQQTVQPQSSAYSSGSSGSSTVTGNQTLDKILQSIQSWVTSLQANGKIINPDIEINSDVLKEFAAQAAREIDPYYASQFQAIQKDLESSFDYVAKNYELQKQDQQAQFRQQLGLQRENEAEKGTLFSGGRRERVNTLTGAYNRQLQSDEMGFLNTTRGLGRKAEDTIGSSNLSNIKIPTVNSYQARTLGEGDFSTSGTRSLFSPSSGITGSLERQKLKDTELRKRELESGYRAKRGIAELSGTVY